MRTPNEIVADALAAIHAASDLPALEQVKAGYAANRELPLALAGAASASFSAAGVPSPACGVT